MTIELRPLGVACNLGCTYCYQEPQRKANGNRGMKYDIDKMLQEVDKVGQPFSLFGGEILLVPKKDLEKLFKHGFEKFKHNGIQTNGTLIDDEHIEMFKKYNVHVGVSIDGPNDLNGLRKVRGKEDDDNATNDTTNKIIENLRKLTKANISTSVIITLHRLNGSKEQLPRLKKFIRWLGDIGIKHGNIHKLEVDKTMPDQEKHVLTQKENIEAFLDLAEFFERPENQDLKYEPFNNYYVALVREDFNYLTCFLNRCDPMNTQAVYGIEGDGALSNCGRTNKEGIDWYKADDFYFERYISLYYSPHEIHGCQGCRFFMLCGGGCPGEAIDGDFRNKTIHCATMKALLGYYEKVAVSKGIVPWTKRPDRKMKELIMIDNLKNGQNINYSQISDQFKRLTMTRVEVRPDGNE